MSVVRSRYRSQTPHASFQNNLRAYLNQSLDRVAMLPMFRIAFDMSSQHRGNEFQSEFSALTSLYSCMSLV